MSTQAFRDYGKAKLLFRLNRENLFTASGEDRHEFAAYWASLTSTTWEDERDYLQMVIKLLQNKRNGFSFQGYPDSWQFVGQAFSYSGGLLNYINQALGKPPFKVPSESMVYFFDRVLNEDLPNDGWEWRLFTDEVFRPQVPKPVVSGMNTDERLRLAFM